MAVVTCNTQSSTRNSCKIELRVVSALAYMDTAENQYRCDVYLVIVLTIYITWLTTFASQISGKAPSTPMQS